MDVLVTGATGFIGGHLARRLAKQGHRVRVLVRRAAPALEMPGVELYSGDLRHPESLQEAVAGTRMIYHLAALRDCSSVPWTHCHAVNVAGTKHLFNAAVEAGVERFIYCSSVGVARAPGRRDADETLPYLAPTSQVAYHQSKAEAEQLVLEAAREEEMAVVVVRPVITYGPEDETGMVTRLLTLVAHRRFLMIGAGENHLDLAYIDDVVAGMLLAAERGRSGRVYILSSPQPRAMREIVELAGEVTNRQVPTFYVPTRAARTAAGAVEKVWRLLERRPPLTRDAIATLTVDRGFSHTRAQTELGYRPQVNLENGFQQTAAWLRAKGRIR
jgi:nucleoside-diphosphate-sugar epimerase